MGGCMLYRVARRSPHGKHGVLSTSSWRLQRRFPLAPLDPSNWQPQGQDRLKETSAKRKLTSEATTSKYKLCMSLLAQPISWNHNNAAKISTLAMSQTEPPWDPSLEPANSLFMQLSTPRVRFDHRRSLRSVKEMLIDYCIDCVFSVSLTEG
ncbi:uncharacterized protein PADG_12164 [Paracoccidioides brasiliensis Pb18]|uniref:Uncharacterized protein n=1 Tax=Paracoccidioides brasiliensis (strain Pb18) TaxID=502780 RepID=A0A0A0HSU2_PARBD|nr:uncharacterized protein PADG_12164 [Paracoccidioides brasiliensis Pb18]KGM91707.1 hypothetical protein PADG_12164 [Paracoccidioides brasiliensis Pb18]